MTRKIRLVKRQPWFVILDVAFVELGCIILEKFLLTIYVYMFYKYTNSSGVAGLVLEGIQTKHFNAFSERFVCRSREIQLGVFIFPWGINLLDYLMRCISSQMELTCRNQN